MNDKAVAASSVIEAAVASARFPGLAPAWVLPNHKVLLQSSSTLHRRWNFVDGGYADGSGALTALEIYDWLKKHLAKRSDVDLRLILITEVAGARDLAKVPNGTSFNDTLAPVTALLNVRSQLATRAVVRAIEQVLASDSDLPRPQDPNALSLAITARDSRVAKSDVFRVKLDTESLAFALGWKISSFRYEIIRRMLGHSRLCAASSVGSIETERLIDTVRGNSCIKYGIVSLIKGVRASGTLKGELRD
ncbi:MAG: hypothetical protein HC869_10785 [Rhodospirillales bacterium]|nr:hypothetical protein [Rhodospirillales bacterium]